MSGRHVVHMLGYNGINPLMMLRIELQQIRFVPIGRFPVHAVVCMADAEKRDAAVRAVQMYTVLHAWPALHQSVLIRFDTYDQYDAMMNGDFSRVLETKLIAYESERLGEMLTDMDADVLYADGEPLMIRSRRMLSEDECRRISAALQYGVLTPNEVRVANSFREVFRYEDDERERELQGLIDMGPLDRKCVTWES